MSDGFLGRWSRRKHDAREGRDALAEPAPSAAPVPLPAAAPDPVPAPCEVPEAAPTLAQAEALTPESDFSRFAARSVAPEVRNAAMKQLFRDPHFNVMDGLDTYIDDYTLADPMSLATLRQLASAEFLGLVQPEKNAEEPPKDPSAPDVAQSCEEVLPHEQAAMPPAAPPATASPNPYAHAHLRLQPNHASPDGQSGDGDR